MIEEETRRRAMEAYAAGASTHEAGKLFGVRSKTISRWLKLAGQKARTISEAKRGRATRRGPMPKGVLRPRGNAAAQREMINLLSLSDGECLRLRGLCEFASCRYRTVGGGCAIKIANNGGLDESQISQLLGMTRQGVNMVVHRTLTRIKSRMKEWKP